MRKSINIFIIITFLSSIPLFGMDKNELFNKIKNEYKDVKNVLIEFNIGNSSNGNGSLIAKKGNKYKIDLQNRIIVCNGHTLWNYSKNDNKVLISNFKDLQNISLEKLFFSELNDSSPLELNSVNSTNSEKKWELKLKNQKSNLEYNLYFNSDLKLISIKILDYKQEWYFKRIETNLKDNESFDFKVNDKMEVIDLR